MLAAAGLPNANIFINADNFTLEGVTFTMEADPGNYAAGVVQIFSQARDFLLKDCIFTNIGTANDTAVHSAIRSTYVPTSHINPGPEQSIRVENCIFEVSFSMLFSGLPIFFDLGISTSFKILPTPF